MKKIFLICIMLLTVVIFSSCKKNENNKINVDLFYINSDSFNDGFLDDNKISNVLYKRNTENSTEWYTVKDVPDYRIYIIKNMNDYNQIFKTDILKNYNATKTYSPTDETLILYIYSTCHEAKTCVYRSYIENDILNIVIKENEKDFEMLTHSVEKNAVFKFSNVEFADVNIEFIPN